MLILNNFLNFIVNAQIVQKTVIIVDKKNNFFENCLKLLWNKGFILGYKCKKNKIKIFLKYKNNRSVINWLSVVPKAKIKIYYSAKQIWKVNSNRSVIIFSTNQGLQTILDCKRKNIGGKLLFILN